MKKFFVQNRRFLVFEVPESEKLGGCSEGVDERVTRETISGFYEPEDANIGACTRWRTHNLSKEKLVYWKKIEISFPACERQHSRQQYIHRSQSIVTQVVHMFSTTWWIINRVCTAIFYVVALNWIRVIGAWHRGGGGIYIVTIMLTY